MRRIDLQALLLATAAMCSLLGWPAGDARAQIYPDLDSPEAGDRVQAVFAVRAAADRGALPKLAELVLADEHKGVRLFAAMAIGELGGVEHVPVLEQVVARDGAPEVQQAAEKAIQQIAERAAAEPPPPPPPAVEPQPALEPAWSPAGAPAYLPPGAPAYPPPGAPAYPPLGGDPAPAFAEPPALQQPPPPPPAPAAAPLLPGLFEEGPRFGDAGVVGISGQGRFSYQSRSDTLTARLPGSATSKDLVTDTSRSSIGFEAMGSWFLLERLALIGLAGLQMEKTNTSEEKVKADGSGIEVADTSVATNDLVLAVGAGYLAPLSDSLFGGFGLLGGFSYRMGQLATLDESGLGFQGRGLVELRYALHQHVHLVTSLQGIWSSRRVTRTPLKQGSSAYDQDQTALELALGLGLATWF